MKNEGFICHYYFRCDDPPPEVRYVAARGRDADEVM